MKPFFGKVLLAAALFVLFYFVFTWVIISLGWALRLLEPTVIMVVVFVIAACGLRLLWSKK